MNLGHKIGSHTYVLSEFQVQSEHKMIVARTCMLVYAINT